MLRYFKLFGKFFRYSIITQMQYRGNFLLMIPVHLAWTLQEVILAAVLYLYTDRIYNWTKYEFLLILGTYFIVDSLFSSVLLPNLNELSDRIRTGEMDFFILKPVDTQFLVFTYRVDLGLVFAFSIGVFFILYSLAHLHLAINLLAVALYILLVANGAIVFASIIFILSSFVFQTIKIDYVQNIFLTFAQFARKPFDIYPSVLRYFMMFVIPLGFIAYVPAGFLLGKIKYLWSLSFVITPLLFSISRVIWKQMIKSYGSASS